MMTEAEVSRALDQAYADADKAFVAVNGAALETHSTKLMELAESIRRARDAIGTLDLQTALTKQSP